MPRSCAVTDIGLRRELNEDSVFASDEPIGNLPNLYIVADGMGGHNAGELASQYTVHVMKHEIGISKGENPAILMRDAIHAANTYTREKARAQKELRGMGTTVVACTFRDDLLTIANVGDSRLYLVTDELQQVTIDHSLVEEMVKSGGLDRALARNHPNKNIITRAIGAKETVEVDFFQVRLREGDLILLCSDGLTNMVEDSVILEILKEEISLEERAEKLVQEANRNGGKDNISVVLIDPKTEDEVLYD